MKISDYGTGIEVRGVFYKDNESLHKAIAERISLYNKAYGEDFSEAKIGTLGLVKYNGNKIGSVLLIPVGHDVYVSTTKRDHYDLYKFVLTNKKISIKNIPQEFITMAFNNLNSHSDTSEYNLNKHGWYKLYVK